MASNHSHYGPKRRYMAAMVLGTAISTFGVPPVSAGENPEVASKSINDISRYCTSCWRNARLPADCWNDCTQEVFNRLLQRLQPTTWNQVFKNEGYERKEFLRAIDAVKKRTQRRLKRSTNLNGVVADSRATQNRNRREERELIANAATKVLTARQQQILNMSFEGWSVQDIANEISIPAERVSDEKYKAIRKLRTHLQVSA